METEERRQNEEKRGQGRQKRDMEIEVVPLLV